MKKKFCLSMLFVFMFFLFASLVKPSSVFATYFIGLGDLPGGITYSDALAVSADGSVVVGFTYSTSSWSEAFRWDAVNGMVGLGNLPDVTTGSSAHGVSADGSVVVGFSGNEAFRWDAVNGMVGLGGLLDNVNSAARGVSADGSVVVGQSKTPHSIGIEAFRWDATNGMVGLGDLPGGDFYSYAMAICLRYAYTKTDASEILNDSFLKVFNNIDGFDEGLPFKPWLRKIVVNTAIDYYRKNAKFIPMLEIEEAENEGFNIDAVDNLTYYDLKNILDGLPEPYRLIFNLYEIDQLRL